MSASGPGRPTSTSARVALAWFVTLAAFLLTQWSAERWAPADPRGRLIVQSLVLSALVLGAVWLLRSRLDRWMPSTIGAGAPGKGVGMFALGLGLFLVPIGLSLAATAVFGWAELSLNAIGPGTLLIGIMTVVLFEALPEELIFRGYIYTHLETALDRWKAALVMCFESLVATEGPEARPQRGGTKRRSQGYANEFQRSLGAMPPAPNGSRTFETHH